MSSDKESGPSHFGKAVWWGAGFVTGSLIFGGILKWVWKNVTSDDEGGDKEDADNDDDDLVEMLEGEND